MRFTLQVGARKSIPTNRPAITSTGIEEHMYSSSVMIVTRSGNPAFERTVLAEKGINRWFIDPQKEILFATRTSLSRDGCVISFMDGLVAAGHTVILRERRKHKYWNDYTWRRSTTTGCEYFLFGFAWGKGQWDSLRAQLCRTIVPSRRIAVLAATGDYYFTHRFEQSIALRVPIV